MWTTLVDAQASSHSVVHTDPQLRTGTLANGLRYYIRQNTIPAGRAYLTLLVDAGSILEDDDQRGLAHFVEHMAFNGTQRFPRRRLIEYMESVGMMFGSDINAFTSFDETGYTLTSPTAPEILDTAMMILEDWAHAVTFDPDAIDAERGVVMEERRMRAGPQLRQMQRHAPVLLGREYGVRLPIGSGEVLQHAPAAALTRFYDDWYRPDLMTVIAVGDFDPSAMEALIQERFSRIRQPVSPRLRRKIQTPTIASGIASIAEDPEVNDWSASLVFPTPNLDVSPTEATFRRRIVGQLFYNILNERLGTLARTSGSPIRSAQAGQEDLGRDRSAHIVQLTAEEPTTLELGIIAVRAEIARLARDGVTPDEFDRARILLSEGAIRTKMRAERQSSMAIAQRYTQSALRRTPVIDPRVEAGWLLRLVPEITPRDLQAVVKDIHTLSGWLVLADIPKNSSHGRPDSAILVDAVKAGARQNLPMYRDTAVKTPILAHTPTPGKIVREQTVTGGDMKEWMLSNGARVILKPTPWASDELIIRAVAPGGVALATDTEYLSAGVASALVNQSGFGEYDAKTLFRRLSGLVQNWGTEIDNYDQYAQVVGTPRHQETLLQVLHLMFTAPRLDSAEFDRWRRSARRQNLNSFHLSFLRTVSQRHPRHRPAIGFAADSVQQDAVIKFYRDRFSDAGQYTFVIVGDFHPDSIRTLVEQYIGGLPGTPSAVPVRAPDLGIRPPGGIVHRAIVGDDSMSVSRLWFSAEAPSSVQSQAAMDALSAILTSRLMIRLREELGGTYSTGARGRVSNTPYGQQQLTIEFKSAPERARELQRAALAVIDTLLVQGVTEAELRYAQTMLRRQREVKSQENETWVNLLSRLSLEGRSLAEFSADLQHLPTVTPEHLHEVMRSVLNLNRYVVMMTLPVRLAPMQKDELLSTQW